MISFILVGRGEKVSKEVTLGGQKDVCLDFEGNTVFHFLGLRSFQSVTTLLC